MIKIRTFSVGPVCTNCYVVTDADSGQTAVVDPGEGESELIACLDSLASNSIRYVLLTHGHYDHITYAGKIAELYGAKIVIGKFDEAFLSDNSLNLSGGGFAPGLKPIAADITLCDGDTVTLGSTGLRFLHTPGHTVGSGCYIDDADRVIFSGDTLFCRSVGRTDFASGNFRDMQNSLLRLYRLSGDYKVYPGHDIATTLDFERKNNPFMLRCTD